MKDKYDENNVYDLAQRYAVVANNTAKAKGSGAIINEVPEIFQGIESKELVEKLDKLGASLDKKSINKFSLGGKEYTAKYIGSGQINDVYKITDASGKSLCFRQSKNPYLIESAQGIYYETAITQEANKAGVVDIPKLYIANPVGKYANDGYTQGAWQLLEFVEGKKDLPKDGLKLFDWLESKGLAHFDYNAGTCVENVFVDLGGIADKSRTYSKMNDLTFMLKGYQQGETTSQMLEAMIESTKKAKK